MADLILYDRLVVPVPTKDDMDRWVKNKWDPERQAALLKILGPFAQQIDWTPDLRAQFKEKWSPREAAVHIDAAYRMTRWIVSNQLDKLKTEAELGDVRAVAVYTEPDRFDSEWQLAATPPFLRKARRVTPGLLRERGEIAPSRLQNLAKMIVTRLAIPNDGQTDEEVLERAVDLVSRSEVAERRSAFHRRIAELASGGLRDETVVGEFQDDLDAYNDAIQRHTRARTARVAVQVVTTSEAAAGLWAPPVALLSGPTAALGEAVIQRRWSGDPAGPQFSAAALLAEAQRALSE